MFDYLVSKKSLQTEVKWPMSKHSGSDANNNTNLFFNAKKKGGYIQGGEFDSPSSNQKYRYKRDKMCHV